MAAGIIWVRSWALVSFSPAWVSCCCSQSRIFSHFMVGLSFLFGAVWVWYFGFTDVYADWFRFGGEGVGG